MPKIENCPKKGRPPKDNKRDIVLKVRLTAEEDQMLTEISEQMGLTKSAVIRKSILTCYLICDYQNLIMKKENNK